MRCSLGNAKHVFLPTRRISLMLGILYLLKDFINFCFVFSDFAEVTRKLEGSPAEEVKLKQPISQQIHRMCLLRVKLMHFVNSLHNYIMTRVRRGRFCIDSQSSDYI